MKGGRDDPARWVGIKAYITGIVGNTIEMKAKGLVLPQPYADLIKPMYKGHLVMPNPASSGTGFLTVSAVIFLYSSENPLASVAVINMDDAGDTAPATAMCMLIVFANVIVRSFAELVSRRFKRKTQGWRAR